MIQDAENPKTHRVESVEAEPYGAKYRLLVAGDWHGNTAAMRRSLHFAQKNNCLAVIQAGDYGMGWKFYDRSDAVGLRGTHQGLSDVTDWFTEKVSRAATEYEVPVWWIDGNHENYDFMESIGIYDPEPAMPIDVAPMVKYMPRGSVIVVDGKRIMFVGGAYSVDKPYRTAFVSWWPQETLTKAQVDRCLDIDPVDIVISHDAPDSAFVAAITSAVGGVLKDAEHLVWKNDQTFPEAKPNRIALEAILEHHQPDLWIHGHYHTAYEVYLQTGTQVIGLNLESERGSTAIIDGNKVVTF